jgi:5-methylthioadenosine/S-adenosylhomocysteine deaminase
MAGSLVRGKYVLVKITGPDSAAVIRDGAVFQQDGRIVESGEYEALKARYPAATLIGSSRCLVMPGLVNDHFHVGLSPLQLGARDLPLELWGVARLAARDVDPYLDHLYGAVQMLESGTTTVQLLPTIVRHSSLDLRAAETLLRAYEEAGMRVSLGITVTDQNSLVAGAKGGEDAFASRLPADLARRFQAFVNRRYRPLDELTAGAEEICARYADERHRRIRVVMAPRNVHRCSDELLVAFKRLAVKYRTGVHIHLQETVYQKLYGLSAWGATPLQHLRDLGFLGPEVTCGHCVWLTDDDIDVMVATGAGVCHNASSNLRIQSGIAPLNRWLERGIRVALGTDEAGLNDDKDMLQEMRLVLKLHRVPGIETAPPTAHQVLEMATVNGARAAGFGDGLGTLEPGSPADMVLMDLGAIEEPFLDPDVSIVDALVHRGRSGDVDTVIIDGEVVMEHRRLTRVDKARLFQELKAALGRPLQPHEQERRDLSRQLDPYLREFYAGTRDADARPHYHYNART